MILCSCTQQIQEEFWNPSTDGNQERVPVEFCISVDDSLMTKSSITASESAIKNINIYAYYGGMLEASTYSESSSGLSLNLVVGRSYNIYALANTGKVSAPATETSLQSYKYSITSVSDLNKGLPMSFRQGGFVVSSSSRVNISLQRLISRIRFSIDKSALKDFQVTDVKLCQAAMKVSAFSTESKAGSTSEVGDGDKASTDDLSTLNSGGTISFYALENCQGVLLSSNTNAENKTPEKLTTTQSKLCTYLEMTASFKGEYEGVAVESNNVKYRFYLGADNCSDFNIERNKDIAINLTLSEDRIFDDSWKVNYGDDLPKITYSLESSSASTIEMNAGTSNKITIKHVQFADGARYNENDVTTYAEWTSSNTKVATVSDGVITAVASGTSTITVTYNGMKIQYRVTVKDVITYGIEVTLDNDIVEVGSSVNATASYVKYTNGVKDNSSSINYVGTWSTSSSSIASVLNGKITGKSPGTATITIKYNGYTESVTVKVVEKPTYELYVTPESMSIIDGNYAQLTAILKTISGGEVISTEDVSAKATWSSKQSSIVYPYTGGKINAMSEGTTTVTASYNGYSATCTVTVTPSNFYTLTLSESSLTLNRGESTSVSALYNTYMNGELYSSSSIGSLASWSSSDTSIATVSSTGIIRGVAAGEVTISATYRSMTATLTVKVVGASSLALEWTSATITKGDQKSNAALYTVTSSGTITDVTNSATWKSSNTTIATVSKGVITARGAGTATITATYSSISVTCTVTVTASAPDPAYVLVPQVNTVQLSADTYELQIEVRMSDGTVINNVPYTWELTYSQNLSAEVGKSGTGPLQYKANASSLYISIFNLVTTESFYDSSGRFAPITRSYSLAHNMSWLP